VNLSDFEDRSSEIIDLLWEQDDFAAARLLLEYALARISHRSAAEVGLSGVAGWLTRFGGRGLAFCTG
jgi:hypothetical protein